MKKRLIERMAEGLQILAKHPKLDVYCDAKDYVQVYIESALSVEDAHALGELGWEYVDCNGDEDIRPRWEFYVYWDHSGEL